MPEKYQVVLQSADGFLIYESTALLAVTIDEAARKARDWADAFRPFADDAWLLVSLNGRNLSLKPGEF